MTGDNPFADDEDDLDKTVVRPVQPAPASPAPPPQPAPYAVPPDPAAAPPSVTAPDPSLLRDPALLTGASVSRLMDAAAPMLALIVAVRDLEAHTDPEALLDGATAEIRSFETNALAAGYTAEQIRLARYALCATMDDVVLATPWGGRTVWNSRGLVSTIHRETMSGERFYALLETLSAKPDEHHDVLQLFYACLSLGFEGKYRVMPRGATELNRVRDRLYRLLTTDSDAPSGPLSPAGAGRVGNWRPLGAVLPVWVPLVLVLLIMAGLHLLFAADLQRARQAVYASPQQFSVSVARADVPLPPSLPEPGPEPEVAPEPVPDTPPFERISSFLAPEVARQQLEVLDLHDAVAVRVSVPDQFASGGAGASDILEVLLRRIGQALAGEEGDVAVLGHTDSVPMRANGRFADNTALSQARAEAAADLLRAGLAAPRPVDPAGMGPDLPIADNTTPEGRTRNRRIEVVLSAPGVPLPQAFLQLERLGSDGGVR